MNKLLILIAAITFAITNCHAQDYKTIQEKTFIAFDTTWDYTQKANIGNKLSLIAKKYNTEWTAHYYAAYAQRQLSYLEKDESKRDAYLDEADKEYADMMEILKKDNEETYILAAMIANARLAVKPMNRWQKYGKIFDQNIESAKAINPNNPRIYLIQGMSKYYTPKAFGGGAKNAKPYFEKAAGFFANDTETDITKPHWGKQMTAYMLDQCNKD